MVFVAGHNAVPASMVAVGNTLLLNDGSGTRVTRIGTVTRVGAYAPFTESGTIAVSGVLASSYISLQENSEALIFGGIKVVSMQWAAHTFLAPHRMICRLSGCNKESYTDDGISTWVYGPYLAAQWLVGQQSTLLTGILLILVAMAGMFLNLVEAHLFGSYMSVLLMLVSAGIALTYFLLQRKGKTKIL
jgi:hypothetical protein